MTREQTLAEIAALPVSKEVQAHATRLIEELPGWRPMPERIEKLDDFGWQACCFSWTRKGQRLMIQAVEDGELHYNYIVFCGDKSWSKAHITDRDVWELLRQLTGMVALTRGG